MPHRKPRRLVAALMGAVSACIMSQSVAAQTAIKPTVMVMPSRMFMKEKGVCTPVTIDGQPRDNCDYQKLLTEDKDFAMIVASVAGAFQERGYPIRSLEAALATMSREATQRLASQKVEQTNTDLLLRAAQPDLAIEVKSEMSSVMGQKKITLILDGIDVYVDEQVATKSMTSNPSASLTTSELSKAVVVAMMPDIESKLMSHFQRMATEGRRVKLRVEIAAAAGLADGMESEVKVDGQDIPLGIYTTMLAEKMAVNKQFQPGPSGDTFVAFNSFNIPFGETPRLFLFKVVQQFKKDTGLNAKASSGAGLGDLLILVDAPVAKSEPRMIARMIALAGVVAYTVPAAAQPPSGAPPELDRVQLSVVLSPRTGEAMGNESVALKRAVEAGLASRGMGTAVSDLSSRFVAYVDLVPIQEEQAPGGMVVVKEQLSITFGEATGGPSIGLFQAERTAVGKNKEGALRNFSTSLKLATNRDFITSLDAANTGIIDYFERQCAGLIREANAKVKQREFEDAIYMTTTVPREAAKCHRQAMAFAATAYTAMLKHQCAAPYAQAKAKWAASKSRQNASEVADLIGSIPADSPCYGEASVLIGDVTRVIAQHDAAEAQARRDRVAWQKKVYEDRLTLTKDRMKGEFTLTAQGIEAARQVGIERARALAKRPADVNQLIVFR